MEPSYAQLTKELQKRSFVPVYLFHGPEPYFIDLLTDYLSENVLTDVEKEFNLSIVYGRDVSAAIVVNLSRQFPMMGEKQVVVVREAQDIDFKKDESVQRLVDYANNPSASTVLALGYKYKAPPAKLLKAYKTNNNVVVFESKEIKDDKLKEWISQQANMNGYSISTKAISMLNEFLGNDLERIANELGKLYINHPKDQAITEEVIEKYIGISKDFNIFELQSALANRDVLKTNRIVHYFIQNPADNSIFKTIPMLFSFFTKVLLIHSLPDKSMNNLTAKVKMNYYNRFDFLAAYKNYSPAKVQNIISWLRECNVRAVGMDNYSVSEGELLRELIFKILH